MQKTEAALSGTGVTTRYLAQPEDTATLHYYLGGKEVAYKTSGTLYYLHQDHLGSSAVVTNSSGAVVESMAYYPYGATRTGAIATTEEKFTGQRLDGTGLYFYNARSYDPNIGRFISADTIVPDTKNPQSWNRYSYVLNNPLAYADPSGNWPQFVDAAINKAKTWWNGTVDRSEKNMQVRWHDLTEFGQAQAAFIAEPWNSDIRREADDAFMNLLASDNDDSAFDDSSWIDLSYGIGLPGPPPQVAGGFRGKLMRYSGKTAEEVAGQQAHHVLATEFKKRFSELGLKTDMPEYGAWWESHDHLSSAKAYNAQWREFLDKFKSNFGRDPTAQDVLDQAARMAETYGFNWVRPQ